MSFDDLARDRQAKAGVLAEALMRPVGVEALEDAFHGVRLDARSVVVDGDFDRVAQPPRRDVHGAVLRRERARVFDQVVDHLTEPRE